MGATIIQIPLIDDSFVNNNNAILTNYLNDWNLQVHHKMRTYWVPTLFSPNTDTVKDEQLARYNLAEEETWRLVLREGTELHEKVWGLIILQTIHRVDIVNGVLTLAFFFFVDWFR